MVQRGRKGSRADLTHKDLAKALKQKQQCKMCDKVENRLLVEGKTYYQANTERWKQTCWEQYLSWLWC